ncbi:uncharacterized protein EKO05_0010722 [Ascochyta rabiei]|uniref:Uncharacterized protein n=1 Tax=Didymella rabiei TaxID=5454 RepID=A0A163L1R8_DIDRA|nr:uncharacterized protein EKO05_0010722 [Ascochyta rabiei]KZM27434.1 hypothetical protein ST47_g1428 [Ascochyta rabiei]UPX20492.1 hypothetical protein EKO05_0010722 [Ascochyta rabiei]
MMLPSTGARSPMFALACSAGFVLVFVFGFLAWSSPERIPFPHSSGSTHVEMTFSDAKTPNINDILRILYEPLRTSPSEPFIREPNGTKIMLPENPRYTKEMGNDILILDLDTRPLKSTEKFEKGEYEWRNINHVSGGVFAHYAYAQIHGYDYKFVHASEFEDRHATWIKPSALANLIKKYKFIVFLDADATFRFMNLPIEWMMNYWKVEPHHSIVMAKDPWDPKEPQFNSDRFNRTYTNTGFMIVQNNKQVMPILKAWHECPEDVRYPNCSQWKQPKFHEQSAFGEYIRYDYEENIKELDCGEANGYPGVEISNCQGKFIRHYWFEKHLVKLDYRENIMNAITYPIQKLFAEKTGVVFDQEENVIH